MSLTKGQIIFLVVGLFVAGILDFYLGARFGPELLWGVKIDWKNEQSILPEETTEEELNALLEELSEPMTFHEVLQEENDRAPEIVEVQKEDTAVQKQVEDEINIAMKDEPAKDSQTVQDSQPSPPNDTQQVEVVKMEPSKDGLPKKTEPLEKTVPVEEGPDKNAMPIAMTGAVNTSLAQKPKEASVKVGGLAQKPEEEADAPSVLGIDNKDAHQDAQPVDSETENEGNNGKETEPKIQAGTYTLQIASYADKKDAKEFQKQYADKGYPTYIKEVDIPGKGKWHRIYLGRFNSLQEAQESKDRFQQSYQISPLVVKVGK